MGNTEIERLAIPQYMENTLKFMIEDFTESVTSYHKFKLEPVNKAGKTLQKITHTCEIPLYEKAVELSIGDILEAEVTVSIRCGNVNFSMNKKGSGCEEGGR